eukprot:TRINITY_DN217_c1_g1_i1.p2 TRINITY_DN217_c1_g1~~TRINITY_DN217_c1_g1_i1.p2  ORF type:complete len:481 (+),score=195.25 TRINITY_DN217_c1_g1_i1:53-1495(+)
MVKQCAAAAVPLVLLLLGTGSSDAFTSSPVAHTGKQHRHNTLAMVATPEAPQVSSAAPLTMDEYSKYVQTTYGRYPLTIVRGKGCHLVDKDGKEYLDMVAGISTCALGHADPELTSAVSAQMSRMHHISNLYYIPEQGRLAKWLVENSCADRVFFCNSGAEANEAQIKLARKYAHTVLGLDLPVIITARQSFHGRTLATVTATGQPKYQKDFGPLPSGFEYVTYNDIDDLRATVKRINGRAKLRALLGLPKRGVAGILMEALQGEGGIVPATREFFAAVREICDETGALMMCDEVQTGMGRTGTIWGFENLGVEPDTFSSAKALGAGVPIGAMMCKAKCDVFKPGDHASTFGGNPLACAAGLVIANRISSGGLLTNVKARGEQLRAGLDRLLAKYPDHLKGKRGWGLINGLVIKDEVDLLAGQVVAAATEGGLLLVPAGLKVVRYVPPLTVSEAEIDDALAKTDIAIAAAIARLREGAAK